MISVCLASYNGEKYIRQQIESILCQIPNDSELIISDDGSSDGTKEIVKSFSDGRIRIIEGPHEGVVRNFENLLNEARGDLIFLSDQDDIWGHNKVDIILRTIEDNNCSCVLHDAEVVDADENVIMPSFFAWRKVKHGVLNNIIKNSYTGCCMAFTKELKEKVLPFPEGIEMHDWWIGLIAEKNCCSFFVDDKLISYRRHGNNTNSLDGYSLDRKIKNRLTFIKALI